MEGIGERFGSSFDDVRRDPRPAVAALVYDAVAFGALIAVVFAVGAVPGSPAFLSFAAPGALPSFTDILDVPAVAMDATGAIPGLTIAAALALALAPVAAFMEGGIIGVLKAAYVDKTDSALLPVFHASAQRSFRPLLAYRLLLHSALVASLVLGRSFPGLHHEVLGPIVLRFALVYTPFVVVIDGESSWGGMKRSVAAIADHLATSLVMLLFGLLVTGGASALARAATGYTGGWALAPIALLYAVVGTAVSTFVLKVYLSFRPEESAPARIVPAAAPA